MPLPLPHLLLPGMMMTRMRLRTRTLRGLSRLLPRVLFVKVLITLAHLALREITMVVRVVMALVLTLKMMTLYISIIEVVIKDSNCITVKPVFLIFDCDLMEFFVPYTPSCRDLWMFCEMCPPPHP